MFLEKNNDLKQNITNLRAFGTYPKIWFSLKVSFMCFYIRFLRSPVRVLFIFVWPMTPKFLSAAIWFIIIIMLFILVFVNTNIIISNWKRVRWQERASSNFKLNTKSQKKDPGPRWARGEKHYRLIKDSFYVILDKNSSPFLYHEISMRMQARISKYYTFFKEWTSNNAAFIPYASINKLWCKYFGWK